VVIHSSVTAVNAPAEARSAVQVFDQKRESCFNSRFPERLESLRESSALDAQRLYAAAQHIQHDDRTPGRPHPNPRHNGVSYACRLTFTQGTSDFEAGS
jgi:hypothetical protein